jgi:clan AA aspartic protease (TIGR02281 family)
MYAALGRFCDAITPVETFVAFDPGARRTRQSISMIAEYSKKGGCGIENARGSAQIPFRGVDGVQTLTARINGVTGTFIVDSGATYLTVTTAFSERAKVTPGTPVRLPMKTVGGTVQATLGTANAVAVGNAEARSVTVAVIQDSRDPFGARIDGLLGMSFLARFNTRISPKGIELTAVSSLDTEAGPSPNLTPAPSVKARAPELASNRPHRMHTAPVPCRPIAWAAPRERSRLTPRTKGPRSLMTTLTDCPVLGLVTVRCVPNGRVR